MDLTEEQMRLIALLPSDPGFVLLLDSIQADLDDLADQMEVEQDDRKLAGMTREWQAMRKVLGALKSRPEMIRKEWEESEHYPEELRLPPPVRTPPPATKQVPPPPKVKL